MKKFKLFFLLSFVLFVVCGFSSSERSFYCPTASNYTITLKQYGTNVSCVERNTEYTICITGPYASEFMFTGGGSDMYTLLSAQFQPGGYSACYKIKTGNITCCPTIGGAIVPRTSCGNLSVPFSIKKCY